MTRGLLIVLSLFILAGLSTTIQPLAQAQTPGTGYLEEIVSLRARNRKVFRHVGETRVVDGWEIERRTMQVSLGSLHYLDENGQWQDVDTTPVDAGAEFRVDKVNAPVRLPKVATAPMVIKAGSETVTVRMAGPAPVAASLQSVSEPLQATRVLFAGVYPQTDIAYEAEADGLREFLTLKGPGHPTAFTYQVETPLAMSIEQGEVVFRDRDGRLVGKFSRPFVLASATETRWGKFSLNGERLTMSLPDLTGLSYPITVDPTFYRQVTAGADDGYAVPAWSSWNSGDVRVNFGKGLSGETYETALRFVNVTIPQGTTITEGKVKFRADNTQSASSTKVTIAAADGIDNDRIDSYNEWNTTSRTTASVNWTIPSWTSGSLYYTPDFDTVIQEAVNESNFNDTFLIFFDDNGSSTGATRSAYSYDGNSSYAPELQVTYNVKTSYLYARWTDRSNATSTFYLSSSDTSGLQVDYAVDTGSGFGSYETTFLTYLGTATPAKYCSPTWYYSEGRWKAAVSTNVNNIKWRIRVPSSKTAKDSSCNNHTTTEAHAFWVTSVVNEQVQDYLVGLGIWP
jgi:hypothetical protein